MPDEISSANDSLSAEAEEAALLDQFKSDYSKFDGDEAQTTNPQAEQVSGKQSSDPATETAEPKTAEGDAAKDVTKPDNSETSAEADKPTSSYQARKTERDRLLDDQRRLAENWKKFDEGKLKWQEQLNQELASLKKQLEQTSRQPAQTGDARFSPQEFQRASEWFEDEAEKAISEGDIDRAREMLGKARQTRVAAQQQFAKEQQTYQQQAQEKFQSEYRSNAEKLISEHPELNQPNNPIWAKMQELLDKVPVFTAYPDGFKWAYDFAKRDIDAAEVSGLREKLTEQEKRNKEILDRTQLKGGGITKPLTTDVDAMSDDEQEEFLRRRFAQANSAE